jgi:hypothetical protein
MYPPPGMPMMVRPPMPGPMPPMDGGVPAGMANAFTTAGTTRPIPANFGPAYYPPNAFVDQAGMTPGAPQPMPYPPAMPYPPMAGYPPAMMMPRPGYGQPMAYNPAAAGPATPEAASVPQLVAMLKEAMYPSQREMAADRLGSADYRKEQPIVEALVLGAREDPAATVRAACVRALNRMKAEGPAVESAVRELKNDRDERVRRVAEQSPFSVRAAHGDPVLTPTSTKLPPLK